MSKEQINFKVLLRSPKYPVIVIGDDVLSSAYNIKQLGTLCILYKPFDDDEPKVIDSTGAEFKYFPEHTTLMPGILNKRWTKKQIIELYNTSVNAEETNITYPLKSISNKKLSRIIGEICDLLRSERGTGLNN